MSSIKLSTKGLDALKKQMQNVEIKVGLPKGTPQNDEGKSLIEIGAQNEFGSPAKGIPERSFIRIPLDDAKEKYFKVAQQQGIDILNGKISVDGAIEKIGVWGQTIIKKSFTNNNWKANSKMTVDKKGSSKPLIDTGQLRQSITWEIVK